MLKGIWPPAVPDNPKSEHDQADQKASGPARSVLENHCTSWSYCNVRGVSRRCWSSLKWKRQVFDRPKIVVL